MRWRWTVSDFFGLVSVGFLSPILAGGQTGGSGVLFVRGSGVGSSLPGRF